MNMVLASVMALTLVSAPAQRPSNMVQGGTGPQKLGGPTLIGISLQSQKALHVRTIFYYRVTLNQTSLYDTTVTLSGSNGHVGMPPYMVVPAGEISAQFGAWPVSVGTTTLHAYNANGNAYLDVEVEP